MSWNVRTGRDFQTPPRPNPSFQRREHQSTENGTDLHRAPRYWLRAGQGPHPGFLALTPRFVLPLYQWFSNLMFNRRILFPSEIREQVKVATLWFRWELEDPEALPTAPTFPRPCSPFEDLCGLLGLHLKTTAHTPHSSLTLCTPKNAIWIGGRG